MALGLVLFYYATTSEVAWLFLLAYWVGALIVASFFYAIWNLGIVLSVNVRTVENHADSLPEGVPDSVICEPFELDSITCDVMVKTPGGQRGPVRMKGRLGSHPVDLSVAVVTTNAVALAVKADDMRRGPVLTANWELSFGDPLGMFVRKRWARWPQLNVVLPRFASLRARPPAREVEAAVTAPRAGSGTEIFGVREYRPGDPLRRIHWRSTARRGELIVREFEPPGVQNLGIFLDPSPISTDAADQVARLAASEAWDCLRAGGRVTLWAPGCEPSRPDEERNLLALLEWLARYPKPAAEDQPPPIVGDAIAVTSRSDARLLEAVEDVRAHGGAVRAWVVGEAVLESDIDVQRTGLAWPL